MSKSNFEEEVKYEYQQKLDPFMEISGISESREAIFFQGRWRSPESYHMAKNIFSNGSEGFDIKLDKIGEQGTARLTKQSYTGDKPKYWLHALLFVATIITTLFFGALMEGHLAWPDVTLLRYGIPFSLTLMLILTTHEFGHYLAAKKHKVDATLPYFIPAPTLIGTFGAFIKMKSPIVNKRALLDIGAAGPIAGFIVTIPALIIGLNLSDVVELSSVEGSFQLGDSIIMWMATNFMYPDLGPGQDIMLHPVAFAGWIGLLVTALNLLPIGQLDGGHIAYAMFGDKHIWIARIAFAGLIPLSFLSTNWIIWAALILFLIRIKHPPIMNPDDKLPPAQQAMGWAALAIFVGCFIPQPFVV